MNQPYTLVYSSLKQPDLDEVGLLRVLCKCHTKNTIHNIKSLLIYNRGRFIHCLQGDEKNITHVFASIRQDVRHSHVKTIFQGNDVDKIAHESLSFRFTKNKIEDTHNFDFTQSFIDKDSLFSMLNEFAKAKHLNPAKVQYKTYKEMLVDKIKEMNSNIYEKYKGM